MNRVFLSLGSNISPQLHIPKCIEDLKKELPVKKVSPIYETPPVGPSGNFSFWNLVIEIETPLTRKQLQLKLRTIEERHGRVRSNNKFAPRSIDIDILPQEDYQNLAFIIIPLSDISPDEKDLETGKTFRELAQAVESEGRNFKKIKNAEVKF